ncbi:Scr1 family TA system antitoxin-like transcriptional regulator [Streptomyces sp. NPDC001262]|uniref:helix-turn-helix domain-containing protein n=1 Tax=Streptomyces sp. NPDC001262 TaxID=3364552 RepID=UPI00368785C6
MASPMAWQYCGNQIKLWRTRAGVSREELAKEAGYEYETIKSMEQGRRRPTLRVLQVADQMCGAHGLLLAAQAYLQPEPQLPQVPEYMAIEAEAIAISSYNTLLVPGLLQTEDYARALLATHWPPVDDETLEERVAARMRRQEKLTRKPSTLFSYVIYEAALRTDIGGPSVMKCQLHRLIDVGALRNISVQVLPASRCASAHLNGPLVLLESKQRKHYGYVEGQSTFVLHSDAATVGDLAQRYGMIRMQALSAEESADLLRKAAEEQ